MHKQNKAIPNNYNSLISQISETYLDGKKNAAIAVNRQITETFWKVGEHIVEFEQGGKDRAEYGSNMLEYLSKDLALLHGKGFSLSNLKRMRQLYLEYLNISFTYPTEANLKH